MSFLHDMGLGLYQQGPSEFIATIDHDMTFGLGFIPTEVDYDSSLAAAVTTTPFDSGFDPRQRRHLIRAHLVSQLIRVQLVLLD